jgi:hypothetical protein
MSRSNAILLPGILTLHPASSLLFIWLQMEMHVGLESFLEYLANVCLLGALVLLLQKSGMQKM